jgi:DNA-directed RNA polymerase subunit omega
MLYPSLPELLKNVNSRYLLVNVAAKRARDISAESEKEGTPLNDNAVTLALKDIAAGRVTAHIEGED